MLLSTLLAATEPDFNIAGEAAEQGVPGAIKFYDNPDRGFGVFLSGILSMVMVIAALLVLLYLIWGAIEWISAGGDKGKVEKARNRMTQAVIGIIVLASTLAIFTVLQRFLGISVVNLSGLGGIVRTLGRDSDARSTRDALESGGVTREDVEEALRRRFRE